MSVREVVGSAASKKISRLIVKLLDNCSDETLSQLTRLAEKLTNEEDVLSAIRGIRMMLRDRDHAIHRLYRRVSDYLPYESKVKLFNTLFTNAWFAGWQKKTKTKETYGFSPPFAMILSPTLNCNLRCKGCYTLGYGMRHELSYETAEKVLKECEELGISIVTVLGGEPLVYPHLFRMLEGHPNITFQVYTNGTLVTRDIAKRFRDLNTIVVISNEGYETETDQWRGKGVYKKILKAFELLTDERVLVGSSATVTSKNVEVVASEEFVDRMIGLGSFIQMYFLYMPVNGQSDFSLLVTPEQRDLLRRKVMEFRRTKPFFFVDFWNDGPHVEGCIAAGRKYFHVNAMGDIEPCVYTHIATHNVRDTSLREALMSPLFRAIRERQPHNENHLRPCMIIDNPEIAREIIKIIKPRFTHPGAEEVYTSRSHELDEYARRYADFIEPIWEREYLSGNGTGEEHRVCWG
ncbi:MAG: radical SAM protein [Syntrophorhabdales bacterium]|jgi:MoaA/NifB/PqqE/SkfB family radical SAM enzyme